jgi:hypothetical protein
LVILGSVGLHGLGHALAAGPPWRRRFSTYTHGIPLNSLLPLQPIFLPGITPSSTAPRMSLTGLSPARRRWSALCGPAANAVFLMVPGSRFGDAPRTSRFAGLLSDLLGGGEYLDPHVLLVGLRNRPVGRWSSPLLRELRHLGKAPAKRTGIPPFAI